MAHSFGWNRSIILSAANRDMLRLIAKREPESLDALVALTGRAKPNLSRMLKAMIAHGIVRMDRSGRKLAPRVIYDAIKAGVADLDDPALKERIAGLKVIRDQSRVDADRAQATLESIGERAITPEMVGRLSQAARERMRLDGGGYYRRDHLRALAPRVEVDDNEVRIILAAARIWLRRV